MRASLLTGNKPKATVRGKGVVGDAKFPKGGVGLVRKLDGDRPR